MAENYSQVEFDEVTESDKELVSFVVEHCDRWRDWRDTNFMKKWDEYERLYYGIWSDEDKTRDSERARIVTPAIREAVENKTAELLEGITGSKSYFDIKDDLRDQTGPADVEQMKNQLKEDMKEDGYEKVIKEVARTAEIFGTACAEILVKDKVVKVPMMKQIPGTGTAAFGISEVERTSVPIKMIHPRNFLIDPNAEGIDEALGVAVEEYASLFKIVKGIEDGIYRKVDIQPFYDDTDLEPTPIDSIYQDDKVKILRYYGLVPREYLEQLENDEDEVVDLFPEDSDADQVSDLVEAIIVIANDQHLLKAERSPYMMQDRPVVVHRPETVPGRFWGLGTVEKGYNMQKAIDAQIRSHLDSLALTTSPMLAADATRIPRGMKYTVQPGKSLLVNGNPSEILQAFKFGNTDPANYETAKGFENMLLKATGTLDSAELTRAAASGQGGGFGMSVAMSALVKKNKQALINFQEDFLIPMVKKVAFRYMQFDPERYPSRDYKFIPVGSIGMIAKEYEQQQFIGLLQTLGPQSPVVPLVLRGIVESSSLPNREELVQALQQMSQPDPQAQQAQQAQLQAQLQLLQAQIAELNGRAAESQADALEAQARAQKLAVEAQMYPKEVEAKIIQGLSANIKQDNAQQEFERRAKIAELMLKEREIKTKEDIVTKQMRQQ